MFGISLAELLIILVITLLFIRPDDLPEIARFLGRVYYRLRKIFFEGKRYLKEIENEIGVGNLRQEIHQGIADEKSKLEDEFTVIVDLEGKEHKVANIKSIRPDLNEKDLDLEISNLNNKNKNS